MLIKNKISSIAVFLLVALKGAFGTPLKVNFLGGDCREITAGKYKTVADLEAALSVERKCNVKILMGADRLPGKYLLSQIPEGVELTAVKTPGIMIPLKEWETFMDACKTEREDLLKPGGLARRTLEGLSEFLCDLLMNLDDTLGGALDEYRKGGPKYSTPPEGIFWLDVPGLALQRIGIGQKFLILSILGLELHLYPEGTHLRAGSCVFSFLNKPFVDPDFRYNDTLDHSPLTRYSVDAQKTHDDMRTSSGALVLLPGFGPLVRQDLPEEVAISLSACDVNPRDVHVGDETGSKELTLEQGDIIRVSEECLVCCGEWEARKEDYNTRAVSEGRFTFLMNPHNGLMEALTSQEALSLAQRERLNGLKNATAVIEISRNPGKPNVVQVSCATSYDAYK